MGRTQEVTLKGFVVRRTGRKEVVSKTVDVWGPYTCGSLSDETGDVWWSWDSGVVHVGGR